MRVKLPKWTTSSSLKRDLAGREMITTLNLGGCSNLTSLPAEVGQLTQLTTLYLGGCQSLRTPPLATAERGVAAIRDYFHNLAESGAATSTTCKLLLIGDGEAGKTSILRGLTAGVPNPTDAGSDGRTISLELSSLTLDAGTSPVELSCWDLGGQARYAPAQQPFIVPGALYLLVVRADEAASAIADADLAHRILGRWLHYLQARAAGAIVQVVLSHVDCLRPPPSSLSPTDLHNAATRELAWLQATLRVHGSGLGVQPTIPCVCATVGGDESLRAVREVLRGVIAWARTQSPSPLPSIGWSIPRNWLPALALLRALPEGRNPHEAATWALHEATTHAEVERPAKRARAGAPAAVPPGEQTRVEPCRHASMDALQQRWAELARTLSTAEEVKMPEGMPQLEEILINAVRLATEQGAIFTTADVVYLDPPFANLLLQPLVDHRLHEESGSRVPAGLMDYAAQSAMVGAVGPDYHSRLQAEYERLRVLVSDFTGAKAKLTPPLLRFLWRGADRAGDHTERHAKMLCDAGVLFPLERTVAAAYIMPMGLPESAPPQLAQEWPQTLLPGEVQVRAMCSWEAYVPPGLVERAIASLLGLEAEGALQCAFQVYWARGALLKVSSSEPSGAASSSSSPPTAADALLLLRLEQDNGRHVLNVSARSGEAAALRRLVLRIAGGASRGSTTTLVPTTPPAMLAPLLHEFTLGGWQDWAISMSEGKETSPADESAPSSIASRCPEYARAMRFVESIPGLKPFLNWTERGLCFCECGDSAKEGAEDAYQRGDEKACKKCQELFPSSPAKLRECATKCSTYAIPKGWHRFAILQGSHAATSLKHWEFHRKFHGTRVDSLVSILASGVLAKPGDTLVGEGGVEVTLGERPGHIRKSFKRKNKHTGETEEFDKDQVFFSPTIRYAEHGAYATPHDWTDTDGAKYKAQTVLYLLVQPGVYSVGHTTVSSPTRDPVVHDNDVECYYRESAIASTHMVGLLVRLKKK